MIKEILNELIKSKKILEQNMKNSSQITFTLEIRCCECTVTIQARYGEFEPTFLKDSRDIKS